MVPPVIIEFFSFIGKLEYRPCTVAVDIVTFLVLHSDIYESVTTLYKALKLD